MTKIAIARKGIGIIKHLSIFTTKTLDQIYKMCVRPHLHYCDVIYHVPPMTNLFDSFHGLLTFFYGTY